MNQVSLVITDDQLGERERKILEENQVQVKVV